mmetsp:Transcript_13965/g.39709  ORF Transcript_13965/g.39709 Transcript_13965/m.39709 type:complete len:187 (+) Transcript_13965:304-864(+)|eukprot:CAMPEP_0119126206 /NCGR_PEP_ID=MMETSP1310-20130426/5218_1 /TAXON_ID=464262 /ORGANISM="Genus nov. species nov., Strain RCC2339" /LENGTH=186 /DNA_ID=CAMNT_0007116353 /DNA_START=355 /DNA_END=915 /DNA_ORIENTATION=-
MFTSFGSVVYAAEARLSHKAKWGGCDPPPCSEPRDWWLDTADKDEPVNWHYEPLDKKASKSLQVGDIVRVRFVFPGKEPHSAWWNKIYIQIVHVAHYSKGKQNVPRTFRGIILDTYSPPAIDEGYLTSGMEVTFQRRNVIEIPGWRAGNEEVRHAALQTGRRPPQELLQKDLSLRIAYDFCKGDLC